MITISLRRACARPACASHRPAQALTASHSRSHQRRYSSSKPPIPPKNGAANLTTPVKAVGSLGPKEASEKRAGAESRLSKRRVMREKPEQMAEKREERALTFPSVPSTSYLDPKDVYVASFFSNHRPISVTSSVPPTAPEDVFESIFAPTKTRSKASSAEIIYTLASTVKTLDDTIHTQLPQNQEFDQRDRSDIISALTQGSETSVLDPADTQHLDGTPQGNTIQLPNGIKLAIQQIARQFRPFNPPPAPQPISDAQIAAKEAEDLASNLEDQQAQALEIQIEQQDLSHSSSSRPHTQHIIINVHDRSRTRNNNNNHGPSSRFFTPQTTRIEHQQPPSHFPLPLRDLPFPSAPYPSSVPLIEGEYTAPSPTSHRGKNNNTRIRIRFPSSHSLPLRRRKMLAISTRRQRKLKMKRHKRKKMLRATRIQRQAK